MIIYCVSYLVKISTYAFIVFFFSWVLEKLFMQ